LRNPRREVQVVGGRRVKDVLRELDIVPETVLVIRGDSLVTADQVVADDDTIELRPVMSGGSARRATRTGWAPSVASRADESEIASRRPSDGRGEGSGDLA